MLTVRMPAVIRPADDTLTIVRTVYDSRPTEPVTAIKLRIAAAEPRHGDLAHHGPKHRHLQHDAVHDHAATSGVVIGAEPEHDAPMPTNKKGM